MKLNTIKIHRSQTKTVPPTKLKVQVIDAVDRMSMAFFVAKPGKKKIDFHAVQKGDQATV